MRIGWDVTSVQLSTTRPPDLRAAPQAEGTAFYGLLPVGVDHKLGVMLDITSIDSRTGSTVGTAYFGTFKDGSLSNAQERSFAGRANSDDIKILVEYGPESEFVTFRVDLYTQQLPPPPPGSDSTTASDFASARFTAQLHTTTLYRGQMPGRNPTYFFIDGSSSGMFDTPQTRVLQDVDRDTLISEEVTGEVQSALNAIILVGEEAWQLVSITPSGRKVQLSPIGKGILSGRVQTFLGAQGIAGATVQVWPRPFETVSETDGSYRLEVYPGDVWKMLVKKEGYVPFSYYGGSSRGRKEPVSAGERILVRGNSTITHNVELAQIPEVVSGTASFGPFGSFVSAYGQTVTDQAAGDFSYSLQQEYIYDEEAMRKWEQGGGVGPPPTPAPATLGGTVAYICACYEGQRGIVELGGYRSEALEELPISPIGYVVGQRLELTPGFVYVAKAREGMEGHFVIFRVESISEGAATITYLFR